VTAVFMTMMASPGAAQIPGMPVWNNPTAGTGVVLSADFGNSSRPGEGTSYALRANLGLGRLNLGYSLGSQDPTESSTSTGGTAALRLAGGGVLPLALNAQAGYASGDDDVSRRTRTTVAAGLSLKPPLPGLGLEPWISPGLRINHRPEGASMDEGTHTRFGVAGGVNARFGLLGVHAAVDHEDTGGRGGTTTVGLGVHLGLGLPLGS
jgi:hypothetical protein